MESWSILSKPDPVPRVSINQYQLPHQDYVAPKSSLLIPPQETCIPQDYGNRGINRVSYRLGQICCLASRRLKWIPSLPSGHKSKLQACWWKRSEGAICLGLVAKWKGSLQGSWVSDSVGWRVRSYNLSKYWEVSVSLAGVAGFVFSHRLKGNGEYSLIYIHVLSSKGINPVHIVIQNEPYTLQCKWTSSKTTSSKVHLWNQ